MRAAPVTLTLLDPVRGHALHTWTFDGDAVIRVGRGDGNDVTLADPVVSRRHVELVPGGDGEWQVVSLGRHGTWLNATPVSGTQPLRHATVLQLGVNGPSLEFRLDHGAFDGETITGLQSSAIPLPALDRDAVRADVGRIVEGELFRQLQEQAEALKRARDARRSAGPKP